MKNKTYEDENLAIFCDSTSIIFLVKLYQKDGQVQNQYYSILKKENKRLATLLEILKGSQRAIYIDNLRVSCELGHFCLSLGNAVQQIQRYSIPIKEIDIENFINNIEKLLES